MNQEQFKNTLLPFTLLHEGGYVNDKADKGGETYRGISRKNNPTWAGWVILDKLQPLKRGDNINHPQLKEAVANLYYEKYFKANKFDLINSPKIAVALFDMAVNGGYSVKMVQSILNANYGANLLADNVMGIKTLAVLNAVEPLKFSLDVNKYRSDRFKRLVENDLSQEKFIDGWMARIRKLNDFLKTV